MSPRGQTAAGGDDLDKLAAPQRVYGCGRVVHVDEQPAGENGEGEVDWWRAGSARSDARGPQSKNGNVPAGFGRTRSAGLFSSCGSPSGPHLERLGVADVAKSGSKRYAADA